MLRRTSSRSRDDVVARRPRACRRSASISVHSMLIVVDLPAPFGPRKPNVSPAVDRQVDAADRLDVAVALDQPGDRDRRRGALVRSRGHDSSSPCAACGPHPTVRGCERSQQFVNLGLTNRAIVNLRWSHDLDPRTAGRPHQPCPRAAPRRRRAAAPVRRRGHVGPPRGGGRSPHRALRRPGQAVRRVVDRHRRPHGRLQAGSPEAVRSQGVDGRRPRGRAAVASRPGQADPTRAATCCTTPRAPRSRAAPAT